MSVPAKRRSRSKTRRSRAHKQLLPKKNTRCTHCGQLTIAHQTCALCGYYRGKTIVNNEKRMKRLEKKHKQSV